MENLKGKVFNSLRVIMLVGRNKHRQRRYAARCVCGNIIIALGHNIKSGRTKTCGNCSTGKLWLKINEGIFVQDPEHPAYISQILVNSLGGNEKAIKSVRHTFPDCDAVIIEETDITIWSSQIDDGICKDNEGKVITIKEKDLGNFT